MGRVAILGEEVRIQGYGLAGLLLVGADDPAAVRAAWAALAPDVGAVILTLAAAAALGDAVADDDRLVAVTP